MKTEEIVIDGKKMEVVIELPNDVKDDSILIEYLDDTLDLSDILENTNKINLGEFNE